jgi:predicted RNA-binding Zn-ribbon protein involved in translation (DUF1610 family)
MNTTLAAQKTLFRVETEIYQEEQKRVKTTLLRGGLEYLGIAAFILILSFLIRIIFGWLPDLYVLVGIPGVSYLIVVGLYRVIVSFVRSEKEVACPKCGAVHEIFKKEHLYMCPDCWTLLYMGKDSEASIRFLNCAYCGNKAAVTNDHGAFVCPNCGVRRSSTASAVEWKTTPCSNCEELVPQEALYCIDCDQILKPLPTYDKNWEVGKDGQGHFHFARMLLTTFPASEEALEARFRTDNPRSGKQQWPETFRKMPPMLILGRAQRSLEEALQEPELRSSVEGLLPEIDLLYARLLALELKMIQWAEGPDKAALVVGTLFNNEEGTCLDIFSQGPHLLARKRIEKILGPGILQSFGSIGPWKDKSLINTRLHSSENYKGETSYSVELLSYAGLITEAKRFAEWAKQRGYSTDLLNEVQEIQEKTSVRIKGDLPAIAVPSAAEKGEPVEKGKVATGAAAPPFSASITSTMPRPTTEPAKSTRKWGCVLATCGSFILAIGLIIIAAIIYSLFDPDSVGDDPIVVLGRSVICVLPIFLVGLGLLVFGISKLRSQKKKPAAKQFGGNRSKTEKKTRVQAVVGAELINEGNYLDKMNNEEMIDKEDITDLIDALDSPKNYSARNALWNQHKQGDPKVKEALISAMSHKSAKVRAQSIQLLKEPSIGLKDLNVLNLLIQALQDESADVRYESAYALADIRSAKATRPLMELLDDESEPVREYVVYALGEISDPQAVDALKKRVPNETERVRMRIGHALKKIKAVWG